MSQNDFEKHTQEKIDKITIPNMSSTDLAQGYFKSKLEEFLAQSEVIFGDMEEIRENLGYNHISTDKVKGSFVLWSHNIAEPMHAGKLTVINTQLLFFIFKCGHLY